MKIKIEIKKNDTWIGAYWTRAAGEWHIWICLIPCLPIHVTNETPNSLCVCGHAEHEHLDKNGDNDGCYGLTSTNELCECLHFQGNGVK